MNSLKISQPLVSVEWLSQNLDHPDLVILEATIPKVKIPDMPTAFQNFDISGTRFFDLKKVFRDTETHLSNQMPSPEKFAMEVGKLGISNQCTIVVYDHWGIYSSPRVWWMFRAMGHENIAVLDGGFPAWEKAGLPMSPTKRYAGEEVKYNANYQGAKIYDSEMVLTAIDKEETAILDARSEGRFYATSPEPRAELRGGHIPGSSSLHYAKLIKDGKILPPNELKETFQVLVNDNQEMIFSCGSGITACILALGAEMAGYNKLAVYDGSWTDWGGDERLPVER